MIIQILQVIAANWKCSMKLLRQHFRYGETDYSLLLRVILAFRHVQNAPAGF